MKKIVTAMHVCCLLVAFTAGWFMNYLVGGSFGVWKWPVVLLLLIMVFTYLCLSWMFRPWKADKGNE